MLASDPGCENHRGSLTDIVVGEDILVEEVVRNFAVVVDSRRDPHTVAQGRKT